MPYSPGQNTANVGAIGGALGGGAVAGSVLFVGAGAVLAQDNANFFWDAANARLGLGTAAPLATLTVAAPGAAFFGANVTIGTVGGGNTLFFNPANITLGGSSTWTRTAGTIAAGFSVLAQFTATWNGDAGGTTNGSSWAFTGQSSGANATAANILIRNNVNHAGTNTLAAMFGVLQTVNVNSSGAVTSAVSFQSNTAVASSGNLGAMTGFLANQPTLSSTGTIATNYGFRAGNIAASALVGTAVAFKADDITLATVAMRGIQLSLSAGATKHNIYVDGTAPNYIGSTATQFGATGIFAAAGFSNPRIQITGSGGSSTGTIAIGGFSADAAGPFFVLGKSRSAVVGAFAIVQNNDALGAITFVADDGTDYTSVAALIACEIDGVPGANNTPGRLRFSTTPSGSAVSTERLRIAQNGTINVGIGKFYPSNSAGNAQQLNSALYAGNGAPNNGDGANGDFYLRGDGTVAGNTVVYHKEAGAWVALVTA